MESSPFTAVAPVLPAAPYIGGKRNLARRLVALIEATPHETYAEPFVGMGGVFLRRRLRPKAEVINDWSKDVWTFYRVLQEHYVAFLDMMRFQITSRAAFERLVAVDPDTLTDMQRAARFLYLQRTAFGGKVTGRNFGVSHHRSGRFDVTRLASILEDLHERLAGVIVERLPFADFLARYDNAGTLFYIDPPYWGSEGDYGKALFSRPDFDVLVGALRQLKARFILSINDVPETRALFDGFEFVEAQTSYSVQGGGKAAAELIVIGGGGGS
ncbi:DNA adenine methylase [Caulobacter sp. SLTY]|uniref:DNA adenine methylase n=1 Tax=Caulobacter sp. SLTY TaxID=2683262 RepID=UPI0014129974|nr:DNA adenine methylase [Caulobacter sp. SLTY]NBB17564.1 DNA adenine methylase [Caulobacter sp. SLTY]